jgi:hypothetical protein
MLVLSSHLCLGFLSGLLHSGFPTKTLYAHLISHIHSTCPAHPSLLELIARIMGPCHIGTARPQVADAGTASRYEGLTRIYWKSNRGQSTRGGPTSPGLGRDANSSSPRTHNHVTNHSQTPQNRLTAAGIASLYFVSLRWILRSIF